jgi:hypothetical protein
MIINIVDENDNFITECNISDDVIGYIKNRENIKSESDLKAYLENAIIQSLKELEKEINDEVK